jgi:thioredoxin-like negative regulator of GroEL
MFRRLFILTIFALITLPLSAHAVQPYDFKAFSDAQSAGKSVLIHVTAPWCPTCTSQKPTVQSLERSTSALTVFEVDFDSSKDVLKSFRVQSQSTLIMFKGKDEVGRATGITDPAAIDALVRKGL